MATKKKATGGFDFAVVRGQVAEQEAGITFDLKNALGEVQPATITVRGRRSPTFRRMHDEFVRSYYPDRLKGLKGEEHDRAMAEASAGYSAAYDREVRVPNVIGWTGFMDGGAEVECTSDLVIEAMSHEVVRDQIIEHQDGTEVFFTEASAD